MSEHEEPNATLAMNIARRRKELGISQSELAGRMRDVGCAWHQNTVSRVETGKQEVDFEEVSHLAAILGPEVLRGTELEASLQGISEAIRAGVEPILPRGLASKIISAAIIRNSQKAAKLSLEAAQGLYEHAHDEPDDEHLTAVEERLNEALEIVRKLKSFAEGGK